MSAEDDHRVFDEVVRYDCYRLRTMPVQRRVLDIGAHTGIFSAFAACLWPEATIVGVELDAQNAAAARVRTTGMNVQIVEAAVVGSRPCRGRQTLGGCTFGHGLVYGDVAARAPVEPFHGDILSVEAAFGTKPWDLVKVDAEGAELDIVMHAPLERVHALAVEVHPWALPADGWSRMADRLRASELLLEVHPHGEQLLVFATRGAPK